MPSPRVLSQVLIMWILATPVQFYVAARFYRAAYRGALHRRFGMDFLVVLGTTVAYLASVVNTIQVHSAVAVVRLRRAPWFACTDQGWAYPRLNHACVSLWVCGRGVRAAI